MKKKQATRLPKHLRSFIASKWWIEGSRKSGSMSLFSKLITIKFDGTLCDFKRKKKQNDERNAKATNRSCSFAGYNNKWMEKK